MWLRSLVYSCVISLTYNLISSRLFFFPQSVGRLASQIAKVIRGKHKPVYTPNVDCGDHVVVVNAKHVTFTGNKWDQKVYRKHTGYVTKPPLPFLVTLFTATFTKCYNDIHSYIYPLWYSRLFSLLQFHWWLEGSQGCWSPWCSPWACYFARCSWYDP